MEIEVVFPLKIAMIVIRSWIFTNKKAIKKIKHKLNYIQAKGSSPIAYSLEKGANDFINSKSRNIVILITDGKEECQMDPCAVSDFIKKGIILNHLS